MMRIDKYLAEMGQGTRSEIKKLIRSGRVIVDGETVKKPELKIDETTQKVSLDGKQIGYAKKEYYMLHKRMFHAVGKEVIYLKRLSMGSLVLDKTLTKGEYRSLTEEEIKKLC